MVKVELMKLFAVTAGRHPAAAHPTFTGPTLLSDIDSSNHSLSENVLTFIFHKLTHLSNLTVDALHLFSAVISHDRPAARILSASGEDEQTFSEKTTACLLFARV